MIEFQPNHTVLGKCVPSFSGQTLNAIFLGAGGFYPIRLLFRCRKAIGLVVEDIVEPLLLYALG